MECRRQRQCPSAHDQVEDVDQTGRGGILVMHHGSKLFFYRVIIVQVQQLQIGDDKKFVLSVSSLVCPFVTSVLPRKIVALEL